MKFNRQNYFVILGHFFPFTPLTARKIKISKMNKTHEDIIILHKFTKKHDHPLYCSRDVARDRCNCYFILGYTFSFYPPNSAKNENFKALKKNPGYIIILHKSTKNHNQMLCCSWDIARVGCNCYCSFWAIYSPFTPLTAQKIENFRKMKKTRGNIIHLTQMHQKS